MFDIQNSFENTAALMLARLTLSGVSATTGTSGGPSNSSRRYHHGKGDSNQHSASVGGDHLRGRDRVERTASGYRQKGGVLPPLKRNVLVPF